MNYETRRKELIGKRVRSTVDEFGGAMYAIGQEGTVLADENVQDERVEPDTVWVQWDSPSLLDGIWVIRLDDLEVVE